jgi:cell division protease FtsH
MVYSRPQEEMHSSTKEDLIADIKRSIAAYVAERIKFGSTSQGVGGGRGSDFYSAIHIASNMVRSYGMGKSGLVGDFLYPDKYHYLSEKIKETLDSDVQDILQTCIKDVEILLTEKRELLDYFAQELYNKEELEYDEIEAIFQKFGLKPLTRVHTA